MNREDTTQETHEPEHEKAPLAPADHSQSHPPEAVTKIADLQRMNIDQLAHYARNLGLKNLGALTKSQIVFETVKFISERPDQILVGEGVLEVLPDGFGFLRSPNYNYLPSA